MSRQETHENMHIVLAFITNSPETKIKLIVKLSPAPSYALSASKNNYRVAVLLLLLLLLMDKNCLAVQDCQARPQAFESAHIISICNRMDGCGIWD